ncbi:diguanylate cyclase [Paraburkholderia sp. DHOC27]|uniref:GGDEF domain-containing protein n=1 Tax=Paraburkholderia sp. DHOC27 TaxID=2303330 RepID=UPI0015F32625|nr:diguanylate cyclase [Paraburkholderia sp. DHOC27]
MRRPPKLFYFVLIAAAFAFVHAACLLAFRSAASLLTYPFLLLAPTLAVVACGWRALRGAGRDGATGTARVEPFSGPLRSAWGLLAVGLLLWTIGMFLSAWEDLLQHLPQSVAWFSDLAFFLYAVPVLLAISSISSRQRIRLFIWMDAAQALITGYLAYISIFSVVPFAGAPLAPVSVTTLVLVYNAENLILAVAATLRMIVQPRGNERRFYAILAGFLWIYAVAAYIYNAWAATADGHAPYDVLVDIPFLALTVATLAPWPQCVETAPVQREQTLAMIIENVSPIFYTVALLLLSISLMREHFQVGTLGIFTALAVYAARSTTLQGRYIRVQNELHEARDRLEQMALTDALTDTANRRRFDQALVLECNRAARHRHPLALLLVDIDFFKMLNDRYGHPAGDRCLVSVALALQSALPRSGDLLARYGGEEFAAILPATDEAGARQVALTMQQAVAALAICNETATGDCVTVSIGIAAFDAAAASAMLADIAQTGAAQLVERADQALYRAKQSGRNCIATIDQGEFSGHGAQ